MLHLEAQFVQKQNPVVGLHLKLQRVQVSLKESHMN